MKLLSWLMWKKLKKTKKVDAISRAGSVEERMASENMVSGALKSLFAVSEGYPTSTQNDITNALGVAPSPAISDQCGFAAFSFASNISVPPAT